MADSHTADVSSLKTPPPTTAYPALDSISITLGARPVNDILHGSTKRGSHSALTGGGLDLDVGGKGKRGRFEVPQPKGLYAFLGMAFASIGVVYGNLGTSPLHTFTAIFSGFSNEATKEDLVGAMSCVFWTMTLIAVCKYGLIVVYADDNGEGGTFALYSKLVRHLDIGLHGCKDPVGSARVASRGELLTHGPPSRLRALLQRSKTAQTILLIVCLMGTCMVLGDGVLTPALTVLSAVTGIQSGGPQLSTAFRRTMLLSFSSGMESRDGSLSGAWFWRSLDRRPCLPILDTFPGAPSSSVSFGLVYPCCMLTYFGEAAFLQSHIGSIPNAYFAAIPQPLFYFMLVVATLAAVVASQALISAAFSLVKQSMALGCFPRFRIIHSSKKHIGQIYIPVVNYSLMVLTIGVVVGFQDATRLGNAYGFSVIAVMTITSILLSLVMLRIWKTPVWVPILYLMSFGSLEGVYFSAVAYKIPEGAWFSIIAAVFLITVMGIWYYGTAKQAAWENEKMKSHRDMDSLSLKLAQERAPGISIFYTPNPCGIPPVLLHLLRWHPSFFTPCDVMVFFTVVHAPLPFVDAIDRFDVKTSNPNGVIWVTVYTTVISKKSTKGSLFWTSSRLQSRTN